MQGDFEDRQNVYGRYKIALRIAARLMRHGNDSGQMTYVDTAGADRWDEAFLAVWSGRSESTMTQRFVLTEHAWVRKHYEMTGSFAATPRWHELQEWAQKPSFVQLSSWCAPSGPILRRRRAPCRSTRFGAWCWLYEAAVEMLDRLPGREPWLFGTVFHGGWGQYYLRFRRLGTEAGCFGISEAGHFAGDGDDEAVGNFSWRQVMRSCRSPNELVEPLVNAATAFGRL